jgi:hypothetical protein
VHASDEPDSTWSATYAQQVHAQGAASLSGVMNDGITALFASQLQKKIPLSLGLSTADGDIWYSVTTWEISCDQAANIDWLAHSGAAPDRRQPETATHEPAISGKTRGRFFGNPNSMPRWSAEHPGRDGSHHPTKPESRLSDGQDLVRS